MYKPNTMQRSRLKVNTSVEGETIETKIERIINNKEPITDGAPLLYTERKEGIRASTNIRTDRHEVALDGIDKITKSQMARREENGKTEPIHTEAEGAGEPNK